MDLGRVFRRISHALGAATIPYMLTGAFAGSFYERLRSTNDIDIVIAPTLEQLRQFLHYLQEHGYCVDSNAALYALDEQSMFTALDAETEWKIDFMFCKSRPFSQTEFRRRKAIAFENAPLFVATAEDLILAKLEWGKTSERHRQLEDAAIVLQKQWESLDRAYLSRWITDLGLESEFNNALQVAGLQ